VRNVNHVEAEPVHVYTTLRTRWRPGSHGTNVNKGIQMALYKRACRTELEAPNSTNIRLYIVNIQGKI